MSKKRTKSTTKPCSCKTKSSGRSPDNHFMNSSCDTLQNPYEKYVVGELLGRGQFGKVYKSRLVAQRTGNRGQEEFYAIKIIPVTKIKKNPLLRSLLQNQIQILWTLNHRNIIKFEQLFYWEHRIYMVYEYCEGGSLEDILQSNQDIGQSMMQSIFKQIVSACSYAEKYCVMHRDIKPANILFKNGVIKVADWGFSKILQQNLTTRSFVGSPAYMAPEILEGRGYNNKTDVWSLGVVAYECCFGKLPWGCNNLKQLLHVIKRSQISVPTHTNPIMKKLMKMCLEIVPQKRSSFNTIKKVVFSCQGCKYEKIDHHENEQKNLQTVRSLKSPSRLANPKSCNKLINTAPKKQTPANPEQTPKTIDSQLSQTEIQKCTYYLQFAKMSNSFHFQQIRKFCLEYIISYLSDLRKNDTPQKPIKSNHKNSSNELYRNQHIKSTESCQSADALLHKQIYLIRKIRYGNSFSEQFPLQSQQKLTKQILTKTAQLFSTLNQLKHQLPNKSQTHGVTKQMLIQLNSMFNVIIINNYRISNTNNVQYNEQGRKVSHDGIDCFAEMHGKLMRQNKSQLMKSLNEKIIFVKKWL